MDDSEAREQNPNESTVQCSNESMNRSSNASMEQWRNPSITQLVESMNLCLNEPRTMLHRINNLGDQWINEAESMGQWAWIKAFMNPMTSS